MATLPWGCMAFRWCVSVILVAGFLQACSSGEQMFYDLFMVPDSAESHRKYMLRSYFMYRREQLGLHQLDAQLYFDPMPLHAVGKTYMHWDAHILAQSAYPVTCVVINSAYISRGFSAACDNIRLILAIEHELGHCRQCFAYKRAYGMRRSVTCNTPQHTENIQSIVSTLWDIKLDRALVNHLMYPHIAEQEPIKSEHVGVCVPSVEVDADLTQIHTTPHPRLLAFAYRYLGDAAVGYIPNQRKIAMLQYRCNHEKAEEALCQKIEKHLNMFGR